jgi:hypothetical protein
MPSPKVIEPPVPEYVTRLNRAHFVANEGGKAVVYREAHDHVLKRPKLERIAFDDFRKMYMTEKVVVVGANGKPEDKPLGDAWLESRHRRQFLDGIIFDPTNAQRENCYNLWRGFALDGKAGQWNLMQTHIREVLCAEDEIAEQYVLDYFAYMVQKPEKNAGVALVAKGPEGAGKGIVFRDFVKIFGTHGLHVVHASHLVGRFNAHLRDTVCLFADEAFFAGDAKHTSVLKGIITEPTLAIEAKYMNPVMVPNYLHLLMASNEDWVVPAGPLARRFCVLDVATHRVGDRAYFDKLAQQMTDGGLAAMLHDLLERDISKFNPASFPRTDALADQQVRTLKGFDKWWCDALTAGELPHSESKDTLPIEVCGEILTDNLFASYSEFCKHDGHRRMARNTFGKTMKKFATPVQRVNKKVDSKRRRGFWVGELDTARQTFCDKLGIRVKFDD